MLAVAVVLLLFYILFTKPGITGEVVSTDSVIYSQPVSWSVSRSTERAWFPEHAGVLTAIGLSGKVSTQGQAKVYVEHANTTYLIFDSSKLNRSNSNLITGFAIMEGVEGPPANETLEINQTDTDVLINGTAAGNETPPTTEPVEEQVNKTITINIAYGMDSQWDPDNDGKEPLDGVIDFTVAQSQFNWNVNENNLCTRWNIKSLDTLSEQSACNGNEDCCNFMNLDALGNAWNEPFLLTYQKYNSTANNEISSQVVYYDVNLSSLNAEIVNSEKSALSANFQQDVYEFFNACHENCLLNDLNATDYTFIFELDHAQMDIHTITYSVIEPIAENITAVNATGTNVTNTSVVEEKTIQYQAVIGKPVRWKKIIKLNETKSNITVELPKEAKNINVTKKVENETIEVEKARIKTPEFETSVGTFNAITGNLIKFLTPDSVSSKLLSSSGGITGYATAEPADATELVIEEAVTEFEVEYETEAPMAMEQEISPTEKKVTIDAVLPYENILTFTTITETNQNVNLFWDNENRDVTNDPQINFTVQDTNGNGLKDYVEWVTPHLSRQTFTITITNDTAVGVNLYNWSGGTFVNTTTAYDGRNVLLDNYSSNYDNAYDGFSVSSLAPIPYSIAHDPRDNTFWVGDWGKGYVYHVSSTGANLSGGFLVTPSIGTFSPAISGLAFDATDNSLWITDNPNAYVYHYDANGNNASGGFSTSAAGATAIFGIGIDTTDNSFWIGDSTDVDIYHFDSSGTYTGESITKTGNMQGVTFDPRDNTLWWVENNLMVAKHLNRSGTELGSFGFTGIAHPQARGIAFSTRDNSLWVTDSDFDAVRHYINPYYRTGTYTSAILDAGQSVRWDNLTWGNFSPAGTNITFQVRSCDDASCDTEDFVGHNNSNLTYFNASPILLNTALTPDNQYFQYIAYLATNDSNLTPYLEWINVSYAVLFPPGFQSLRTNASAPHKGETVQFNATIVDDGGISMLRFAWNDSGTWVNATNSSVFIGTVTSYDWSVNHTVTRVRDQVIGYRFYANNSDGNWNESVVSAFTVADTPPAINTSMIGAQAYLDDDLVAYYPFEGANTSDFSRNGNDGINYGASYSEEGRVGGGFKFDGVDDYIKISDAFADKLSYTTSTITAWIKRGETNNSDYNHIYNNQNDVALTIHNNKLEAYLDTAAGWFGGSANLSINDTGWHFIALTYDSSLAT